ncbi:hypothetical protein QVE09_06045 [Paenibacillus sp. ClWae2A]|uniref:hypothetical protein n=1 Tax=Paenibacillus sp. ClWae2A TaxID=3057177 RepID=UPI0028F697D7|nr:hypothetical protein [Paenibacillus sp. ClWae2A]MDT9718451.1 hypothetical protein [Paenibacillus sp. ClWae2A]
MQKKIWASLLVVAVIGMIPVTEVSTTMVAESHEISGEELPESLRYDSNHPDIIYVKDCGVYEKVDSSLVDYAEEEIVFDDLQKVTDKTNELLLMMQLTSKKVNGNRELIRFTTWERKERFILLGLFFISNKKIKLQEFS